MRASRPGTAVTSCCLRGVVAAALTSTVCRNADTSPCGRCNERAEPSPVVDVVLENQRCTVGDCEEDERFEVISKEGGAVHIRSRRPHRCARNRRTDAPAPRRDCHRCFITSSQLTWASAGHDHASRSRGNEPTRGRSTCLSIGREREGIDTSDPPREAGVKRTGKVWGTWWGGMTRGQKPKIGSARCERFRSSCGPASRRPSGG
jgi:hypothetical protein